VNTLSVERRLSRYAYLAEKPAESPLVAAVLPDGHARR
jgi:hypothetical protein